MIMIMLKNLTIIHQQEGVCHDYDIRSRDQTQPYRKGRVRDQSQVPVTKVTHFIVWRPIFKVTYNHLLLCLVLLILAGTLDTDISFTKINEVFALLTPFLSTNHYKSFFIVIISMSNLPTHCI